MDVYINSYGDANITEIWDCSIQSGTEAYHPYYNLGKSKIKNLTVSEGETQYQTLSKWNTNKDFSNKAYKCGIKKISKGVELCWGISDYGSHSYTVKYTITNFVSELLDNQMIYWTLIPHNFSTPIQNASNKIRTNFIIPDSTDIWVYGNDGTALVNKGDIEIQSNGNFQKIII